MSGIGFRGSNETEETSETCEALGRYGGEMPANRIIQREQDPFGDLRGKWVRVITRGRSHVGVYRGRQESRHLRLRPIYSVTPDTKTPNEGFYEIIDLPEIIEEEDNIVSVAPLGREYIKSIHKNSRRESKGSHQEVSDCKSD